MIGSVFLSGIIITAGSGSQSEVGSGIRSVRGMGSGWPGSGSGVGLLMSSSVGQMVNPDLGPDLPLGVGFAPVFTFKQDQ